MRDPASTGGVRAVEGLRGLGGPVGTNGRGSYRGPYGYVTDMKPNYVTIYISKHNFENSCNGFVTAVAYVTALTKQDIALSGWGKKNRRISRPFGGFVTAYHTGLSYLREKKSMTIRFIRVWTGYRVWKHNFKYQARYHRSTPDLP